MNGSTARAVLLDGTPVIGAFDGTIGEAIAASRALEPTQQRERERELIPRIPSVSILLRYNDIFPRSANLYVNDIPSYIISFSIATIDYINNGE